MSLTLEEAANRFSDRAELLWHQVRCAIMVPDFWGLTSWPRWLRRLWVMTLPLAIIVQIFGQIVQFSLWLLWSGLGYGIAIIVGVTIILPIFACQGIHYLWTK